MDKICKINIDLGAHNFQGASAERTSKVACKTYKDLLFSHFHMLDLIAVSTLVFQTSRKTLTVQPSAAVVMERISVCILIRLNYSH